MKKFIQHIVLAGILISTPNFPSSISTPRDLSNWYVKEFKYEYDAKDYWKSPREMLKDKKGDCEDFAILSKYILTKKGYKVYVIAVIYKEISHFNKPNSSKFAIIEYYLWLPR